MINVLTVSFFGHRDVDDLLRLDVKLEKLIQTLLESNEYVELLVGRNGEFDQAVSSAIKRVKRLYRDDNCSHVLVLPYCTSEFKNNRDSFYEYYDEVEICEAAAGAHFKAAMQLRNRAMVNRSDLVVLCVERKEGGAYQTYRYAVKQGKQIINLVESADDLRQ